MSNPMEGKMDTKQQLDEALKRADASHAKLMREHPDFVATAPRTLEQMFGPGKAAQMRRDAARLKRQDGKVD